MHIRNWALILLLGIAWGSSFFFNEILLRELGPMWVSLGRVGIGALGCWIWLLVTWQKVSIPRAAVLPLLTFGVFQYAVPLTVYPFTQQFITSSAAGIVNAMTPIMVVIVGHFWTGAERVTPQKTMGVLVGFAGIVILVFPSLRGQGDSAAWALIVTMIAPLCYGVALNLMRMMDGMNRVLLTAWSLTFGTLLIAPISFATEGVPVITQTETWMALGIIGFVLTSAAFILLFWLIPQVGGTTASTITFIAPISAVLLGVLILSETLTWMQLVGMAVIFVGLLLIDGRLIRRFGNSQPNG